MLTNRNKNLFFSIFTIILLLNIKFSNAQDKKIDSLLTLLKSDKADTTKLLHLNKISGSYFNTGSFDLAKLYSDSAIQLGNFLLKKTSDPTVKKVILIRKASSYNTLGNVDRTTGDFEKALKNYTFSLELNKEAGNKKGIADAYGGLGIVYYSQGNFPEALKNQFAALKIREAINDKKGISSSHNNIGIVYESQGNQKDALVNYKAALELFLETGNKIGYSSTYSNIGNIYAYQKNFPEALNNFNAALKGFEEQGNKAGAASCTFNIGNVYSDEGNYPEALKKYFAALEMSKTIGDQANMAASYFGIGTVLVKQKKYKDAEEYLSKGKELSKEIGYKELLRDILLSLSQLDSARGDFRSAFEDHKFYVLYRDSLDNEASRKKIVQSQMTFDFEKKEAIANAEHKKELENQQIIAGEKSRKQKVILVFVFCFLFLVLIFAGFIFRSLRVTRKQRDIIENQKEMVEEKQKEIIDSINYAKRIQQSQLPTEKYIDKNLKRLNKG